MPLEGVMCSRMSASWGEQAVGDAINCEVSAVVADLAVGDETRAGAPMVPAVDAMPQNTADGGIEDGFAGVERSIGASGEDCPGALAPVH